MEAILKLATGRLFEPSLVGDLDNPPCQWRTKNLTDTNMSHGISTYLYGSPRHGEGLRIGTTRYVPRGVRREDWQKKGYFDIWVPLLSPEPEDIKEFLHGKMTFANFTRRYRAGMKKRESRQVIELLAGISLHLPIAVGCFCEDESHCHRSILKQLIIEAAQRMEPGKANSVGLEQLRYASPVCYADWEGKETHSAPVKKMAKRKR